MTQTVVASLSVALSSGTTDKLEELSHQFIVSSQGDEAQPDNSFVGADLELMREDVNVVICYDSDNELTLQLSRQTANIVL